MRRILQKTRFLLLSTCLLAASASSANGQSYEFASPLKPAVDWNPPPAVVGPMIVPPAGPQSGSLPAPVPNGWDAFGYANAAARCWGCDWIWQLMPEGLLYKSYLAGPKEPRFATSWVHDRSRGWLWDVTLGGRVGILRFGSETHPEGFQLDIEGAAFPRLDIEHQRDLESADFRFGVPLTWADGPFQLKFAYYHLSSHVGDEYLVRNPGFVRSNYSRDALVLGGGYFLTPDLRLYGELDYAFVISGGSQPWMIQFGADYSPVAPVRWHGAPFVAINGLLRQEVSWGGGFNLMAGWQWRSLPFGRLVRIGLQYYNGKTSQFEFLQASDEMLGMGFWYDY